jgi:hypothetical protein
MKKQSTGELSRTIAGQWTKSEKLSVATREIMECNRRTHATLKRVAQQLKMK